MACPTCDHTLSGIGYGMFHCPRCGTLANCPIDGSIDVPALVARCRTFEKELNHALGHRSDKSPMSLAADWVRIGVRESINLPSER